MSNTLYRITSECICRYAVYLREQERAAHTVQKYVHDLGELAAYLDGQTVTKAALIEWKPWALDLLEEYLKGSRHITKWLADQCGVSE